MVRWLGLESNKLGFEARNVKYAAPETTQTKRGLLKEAERGHFSFDATKCETETILKLLFVFVFNQSFQKSIIRWIGNHFLQLNIVK